MKKPKHFDKYLNANDSLYSNIVNKNLSKIKIFRIIYIRLKFYFRKFYFFRYLQKINLSTEKYTNSSTDITVDGFQRSANTFAYVGFSILNRDIKIAHHSHVSSQIIFSVKNNIPVLLLIRDPIDSIVSFYIFLNEEVPFKTIINSWKNFYLPLIAHKKKIYVSDFDDTINNFEETIDNVNSFYNTNFKSKFNGENFKEEIFKAIKQSHNNRFNKKLNKGSLALPVDSRNKKKRMLIFNIQKNFQKEIEECKIIYNKLLQ
jgi:hypothetical protein